MTDTTPDQPPAAASYLAAVAELDDLLAALERDDPDIDALAARVARAADLIAFCRARIRDAEAQVTVIVDALETDVAGGSAPGVDDSE